MAFAAPIVLAIGGGSMAAGAITLASAAVAVGTGVSAARAQRAAGKAAQAETQMAATAEGDAARQREIERKRNLLRAISSQQASAAAAGITTGGSFGSLINLDIAEAQMDQNVDTANTRQAQRALTFRGLNARAAGNAAARTSLLDTVSRTSGMFI